MLMLPVTLTLAIDESGQLRMKLHTLGIPLYRTHKKQRRVRLSHYSKRVMARREKKAAKKQKSAAASQAKTPAPPHDKAPLTDKITYVTDLAATILRRSLAHAHVRVDRLTVTVASDDAAKTALLYGAISPLLSFLLETLEQFSHLHIPQNAPIGVIPDFTGEQTRADIRLHFRLHVLHLLDIALHTLLHTLRHSPKRSKR